MAAGKVHFDTGRHTPAACSAYLAVSFAADPAGVTCANCRRSKPWRKAAGIPEPAKSRPHRFRAECGDSRADIAITGTPAGVDGMRELLRRAGFEITADATLNPAAKRPSPAAGRCESCNGEHSDCGGA